MAEKLYSCDQYIFKILVKFEAVEMFLGLLIGAALINFGHSALATGNHKAQAEELVKKLTAQGYTVQRGVLDYLTPDKCQHLSTCYANNPASPYAIVYLPSAAGEDISDYPEWGTIPIEVDGVKMSANFRLSERDTVIMLGQTPPRSLYYSWVPYIFDRWHPKGWSSPEPRELSKCATITKEEGSRCNYFASLGDPLNMLHMNTSMEKGQSFSSSFAHFMGGDKVQVNKIRAMSVNAGIDTSIHNVYPLSNERVRLGLDSTSDSILHLGRVTFTENKAELQEVIKNPSDFVTILRVTPPKDAFGKSFAPNKFSARVVTPEQVLSKGISNEDLKNALENELAEGVKKAYLNNYPYMHSFEVKAPAFRDGYDCLDRGIKCNGDVQDTLYPNSALEYAKSLVCKKKMGSWCPTVRKVTLQPDGSDFFIATGINHNATASALYSSMCMYNYQRLESIGQFTSMPSHLDGNSYVGSADRFLKSPLSKYMFAVKISRKCAPNESHCLQVKDSGPNSLPLPNDCLFIERIYLDEMRAGPTSDVTVKPIVYHFSENKWG